MIWASRRSCSALQAAGLGISHESKQASVAPHSAPWHIASLRQRGTAARGAGQQPAMAVPFKGHLLKVFFSNR